MKFLVDAQLPILLVRHLRSIGHDSVHVIDLDLASADDDQIWTRASHEGEIIVTKDEDFPIRRMLTTTGPAVLWLRFGNCSNRALLQRLTPVWVTIAARLAAGDPIVEVV